MIDMKAQADVISAVIIIVVAIGLVSAAYMWGMPLIKKRQDTAIVERAKKAFDRNNFNSLVKKIDYIYRNGGEDTFTLDIGGVWTLYPCMDNIDGCTNNPCADAACESENNSVQFMFTSSESNIGIGQGWVPVSSPNIDLIGSVGVDDSSVVFAKADRSGDNFDITYKIWFRELDESPIKGYKVDLISPTGIMSSTGNSIRISRGEMRQITVGGKILIITEMKLLFV